MSETRHTPGPWRVVKEGKRRVIHSDKWAVCGGAGRDDSHLIAATPDLLAFAERAYDVMTDGRHELTRDTMVELSYAADAAIRRARGES